MPRSASEGGLLNPSRNCKTHMRTPHSGVLLYPDSNIYYLLILGSVMAIGRRTGSIGEFGRSCGRNLIFSPDSGDELAKVCLNYPKSINCTRRSVVKTTFSTFELVVVPEVGIIINVAACVRFG